MAGPAVRFTTTIASGQEQTDQRTVTEYDAQDAVVRTFIVTIDGRRANEETLRGQLDGVFENLRTVANGTGTFANNTVRDAAIRNSARALVILIRLYQGKLDATD